MIEEDIEIFVHQSQVQGPSRHYLVKGQPVEFAISYLDGQTVAINVTGPGGQDTDDDNDDKPL